MFMLDIRRIERIRLSRRPKFQQLVGHVLLTPNYRVPPGVRIVFEGVERLPEGPVIFAMNHTDRYNYWPFQYRLWKQQNRFTATWVKGKYYEHPLVATFMEWTNNLPAVSRGYVITRDAIETLGRRPSPEEYEALREWVNSETRESGNHDRARIPDELTTRARDMLGRRFEPAAETYPAAVNAVYRQMTRRFVELNREAKELGLDVLVFPQGTRSKRLSQGRSGVAQIALAQQWPIVPVGCSGCDRVYPGAWPVARPGTITYRFGTPIQYRDMREFHPREAFSPLTADAEARYGRSFQGLTDQVMDRINDLVDEPYRFSRDRKSEGVKGTARFV